MLRTILRPTFLSRLPATLTSPSSFSITTSTSSSNDIPVLPNLSNLSIQEAEDFLFSEQGDKLSASQRKKIYQKLSKERMSEMPFDALYPIIKDQVKKHKNQTALNLERLLTRARGTREWNQAIQMFRVYQERVIPTSSLTADILVNGAIRHKDVVRIAGFFEQYNKFRLWPEVAALDKLLEEVFKARQSELAIRLFKNVYRVHLLKYTTRSLNAVVNGLAYNNKFEDAREYIKKFAPSSPDVFDIKTAFQMYARQCVRANSHEHLVAGIELIKELGVPELDLVRHEIQALILNGEVDAAVAKVAEAYGAQEVSEEQANKIGEEYAQLMEEVKKINADIHGEPVEEEAEAEAEAEENQEEAEVEEEEEEGTSNPQYNPVEARKIRQRSIALNRDNLTPVDKIVFDTLVFTIRCDALNAIFFANVCKFYKQLKKTDASTKIASTLLLWYKFGFQKNVWRLREVRSHIRTKRAKAWVRRNIQAQKKASKKFGQGESGEDQE